MGDVDILAAGVEESVRELVEAAAAAPAVTPPRAAAVRRRRAG
jgi:hypothetical protein